MKKIFAIVLALCMAISLCACSQPEVKETEPNKTVETNDSQETTAQTTTPQATEPEATEPVATGKTYTIKVVDEGNNPVAGMMVQFCNDTSCLPMFTDANGCAVYENQVERGDYKASVTMYAEGYEAAGDQTDFYFGEGNYEVTITVKAVA